jgi:hypothetical protein
MRVRTTEGASSATPYEIGVVRSGAPPSRPGPVPAADGEAALARLLGLEPPTPGGTWEGLVARTTFVAVLGAVIALAVMALSGLL